jgi:hypothetical protein
MRKALCHVMLAAAVAATPLAQAAVNVVTTTQDYAAIAREIGGDRVTVAGIVPGNSDPHFLKPNRRARSCSRRRSTGAPGWTRAAAPVLKRGGSPNIVEGAGSGRRLDVELLEARFAAAQRGRRPRLRCPHPHSPINQRPSRAHCTGPGRPRGAVVPGPWRFQDRFRAGFTATRWSSGPRDAGPVAATGELLPIPEEGRHRMAGWLVNRSPAGE